MKNLRSLLLVVMMVVSLPSCKIVAQITPEQAKQAIREFERDPNLQPPDPEEESKPYHAVGRYVYSFNLFQPDRIYDVDKETGRILFAYRGDAIKPKQGTPLSQEQALKIARNFLAQRSVVYRQYQPLMAVVTLQEADDKYCIRFAERIPENGAYSNNMCYLELNAYTGAVIVFEQEWENVPHPNRNKQPSITVKEAGNRVAAYFGFKEWDFFEEPMLFALPGD